MPDFGASVCVCRGKKYLVFARELTLLFSGFLRRISEEAAAMWKKHLERDDSVIVGEEGYGLSVSTRNQLIQTKTHYFISSLL